MAWFLLWWCPNEAQAREYRLDPARTAVTVDAVLTVSATEIDLTPVDFGVFVQLGNVGYTPLELEPLTCGRGATVVPISGSHEGDRIFLDPGETQSIRLLCDHTRSASGDPSVRITTVWSASPGVAPAPILANVVWTLREAVLAGGDLSSDTPLVVATSGTPNASGPLLDSRDIASHLTTSGMQLVLGDVLRLERPTGPSFTQAYDGTWTATVGKLVPVGVTDLPDAAALRLSAERAGAEVRIARLREGGSLGRSVVSAECTALSGSGETVLTIADLDVALRIGEVAIVEHLTRVEAVARLKEARELLDLGVYTSAQFEAEKAKYLPILAPGARPTDVATSVSTP